MKVRKTTALILFLCFCAFAGSFLLRSQAASFCNYDANCVHDGTVGRPYEAMISYVISGVTIKSNVLEGSFPPGLDRVSNKGQITITGTPTTAGTYKFRFALLNDNMQNHYTPYFTVVIAPAGTKYNIYTTGARALDE